MPLTTEAQCRAEMSAAFGDVEVHTVTYREHYASADAFWDSLQRTMAPIALLKQNLGDKWAPLSDAALAAIRTVVGSGPAELETKAWFSVGTAR
jgi:hypothetical protein